MEHLAQSCGNAADVPLFREDRKYDKKVEVCLNVIALNA